MNREVLLQSVDCVGELLDILGYEVCTGRMSPEMWDLLERHLQACPWCQRRFKAFLEILAESKLPTRVC